MLSVKSQFGKEEEDVFSDERSVSSQAFTRHTSCQALYPIDILLTLFHRDWVSFLQHFVDCDEGFEGLDFVCEDGLNLQNGLIRDR